MASNTIAVRRKTAPQKTKYRDVAIAVAALVGIMAAFALAQMPPMASALSYLR